MKYNIMSDDELVADIKRIAGKSKTLKALDYDKRGRSNRRTVIDRFGSWNDALRLAGLETARVSPNKDVTVDKIVADVKRVAKSLDKDTLTHAEYAEHGQYSNRTVDRNVGWQKALVLAGLKGKSKKSYSHKECFKKNSGINKASLRGRILRHNILPYQCSICNEYQWNGKPLALHVDHINGDSMDHRLSNLRLLCPNCHTQTTTYAGKGEGHLTNRAMCDILKAVEKTHGKQVAERLREDI